MRISIKSAQLGILGIILSCAELATAGNFIQFNFDADGEVSETSIWNSTTFVNAKAADSTKHSYPGTLMWQNIAAENSDAFIAKLSNGAGGGPYIASNSIYFAGRSSDHNLYNGTVAIADTTLVSGLQTLFLQIEIESAFNYDFFNHNLDDESVLHLPRLYLNGADPEDDASPSYAATYYTRTAVVAGEGGGSGGMEATRTSYLMQWDLSQVSGPITDYTLSIDAVQHARILDVQVDQSNHAYGDMVSAHNVPEPTLGLLGAIGLSALVLRRRRIH